MSTWAVRMHLEWLGVIPAVGVKCMDGSMMEESCI